jgi:hypothetical protein
MATMIKLDTPSSQKLPWDRMANRVSRGGPPGALNALALLDGCVGLTAACGALFVVPALPDDLLRFDYFFGLAGPAVALGLLAVLSLTGLYGLLARRPFGIGLSIAAGVGLVIFELVESWVVGNIL